ncbi:MAG: hypothetical protein D6680_05130 [Cyanobacteria bacterium J007]|nr:MAG: hypothetical protein D6680_05130 [Cyanobacteria bacterium J007]
MKSLAIVIEIFLASTISTPVLGQISPDSIPFQEFAVEQIYRDAPSPVDLDSDPSARQFRRIIEPAATVGPNFAGRYTIVSWGCGTACQEIAIVDAETGQVYLQPIRSEVGIQFQLESRLLVVNPPQNIRNLYGAIAPQGLATRYYLWDNNRLQEIHPSKLDR